MGRRVCAVLNSKFYLPSVSEVSIPQCVPSGQEGVCCTEQQVLLPQCLWSVLTLVCTQWAGGCVLYWTASSITPVSLNCLYLGMYPVGRRVCAVLNSKFYLPSVSEVSIPWCVTSGQEGVRCTEQQVLSPQCLWSVHTLVCNQWAGGCVLYWTASSISPVSLKCPYLSVYPVGRRVCAVLNSKFYYPSVSEVSIPQCVPSGQEGVCCTEQQVLLPQCLWIVFTLVCTQWAGGCVLYWTASSITPVSLNCLYLGMYPVGRRVCAVLHSKFYYPSVSEVFLPWCVSSGQEGVCCFEQEVLLPQCLWTVHTSVCNQWARRCVLYWTASSITPVSLKCPYLDVYPVGRRVCAVLHSKFYYPSVSEVSIPQCVSIGRRVCAVLNSKFYYPSVSEVSIPWCVSIGRRVCAVLNSKFYYPSVSEVSLPWCVPSGQEGVCCTEQQVLSPQCLWSIHTLVCNQWAGGCALYWTASSITPVTLKCPYLGV